MYGYLKKLESKIRVKAVKILQLDKKRQPVSYYKTIKISQDYIKIRQNENQSRVVKLIKTKNKNMKEDQPQISNYVHTKMH